MNLAIWLNAHELNHYVASTSNFDIIITIAEVNNVKFVNSNFIIELFSDLSRL